MKFFAITILLFTLPALADSIHIDGNTLRPDGTINSFTPLVPGVNILLFTERDISQKFATMGFQEIFMNAPATTSLTWTLTLANLSSSMVINFDAGPACPGTCVLGDDFFVPIAKQPISGTLTVHLNGENETFNFHYITNAPEPTTLVLMGTGLVAIGWRKYRYAKVEGYLKTKVCW
jgi:hypothetical protein